MERIIEVSALKKAYGSVQAVKEIDFYVEPGKLFAFVGPNGAGKSTTIDILCTLLKQDAGTVRIDGKTLGEDDAQIRRSIGVVFQDSVLDPLLTVKENLFTRGRLYGLPAPELKQAVDRAARATGVSDFINRRYGKLSGGQRRRADIARALVNTPKILFLDEPTTGLDPQTRKGIWDTVYTLQRETGMTVFLTTHYMEETAQADYVVVMDGGKIAARGTPEELRQRYSKERLILHTKNTQRLKGMLAGIPYPVREQGGAVTIYLETTLQALPILDRCRDAISGVEILTGNMDDAFISITGKEIPEC